MSVVGFSNKYNTYVKHKLVIFDSKIKLPNYYKYPLNVNKHSLQIYKGLIIFYDFNQL
jgi:hypothetical protein